MRTFLFLLFFSLAGLHTSAQPPYFLYIQSEDRQPFYIRLNEKIYSSSETGYLIISKLEDANYPILLGFPRNIYPEHQFQVRMNKKDKGFQLKRTSEKTWQLVSLQNQEVIPNAASSTATDPDLMGEKKSDAFSVLLANVVNDSAILYTQRKPEPIQTVSKETPANVKKDTRAVPAVTKKQTITPPEVEPAESLVKTEALVETKDTATVNTVPDTGYVVVKIKETTTTPSVTAKANEGTRTADDKPFITKVSEEKSTTMYKAVYLEQYNYNTDTIDISIPVETATAAKPDPVQNTVAAETVSEQKSTGGRDSARSDVVQGVTAADTVVKKKIVMINSDCKNFATDNDVDKLRLRIMAAKDIEDQLIAARRYYRTRCFTVQQVKALTELFASDETKYRFLDLSYAFTSDSGNYYLLEEVISDDYYKNRFKAMIRK